VLKVTKLRKIALIPLRKKKFAAAAAAGCKFFFLSGIRAIAAARCLPTTI